MFQLLDKLAGLGGAENIFFDWWSPNEEIEVEENQDSEKKNQIQQVLLNLCYKVNFRLKKKIFHSCSQDKFFSSAFYIWVIYVGIKMTCFRKTIQ